MFQHCVTITFLSLTRDPMIRQFVQNWYYINIFNIIVKSIIYLYLCRKLLSIDTRFNCHIDANRYERKSELGFLYHRDRHRNIYLI